MLVIAAMLTAIVGTSVGLFRAQKEARTARRVSRFMESMILDLDPFSMRGQTADPLQILDRGAARIDQELADEPLERARLLAAFGAAYSGYGDYERSRILLEEAAAIRRERLGSDHLDYGLSVFQLGDLHVDMGDDAGARRLYLEALEIFEVELPPGDAKTLLTIERIAITTYRSAGCTDALPMAARVSSIFQEVDVGKSIEAEGAAAASAAVAVVCGNEELAQVLLGRSGLSEVGARRPESLHSAKINLNYALTLSYLGEPEQALPYAERAVAIWEKLGGPENREYYGALSIVATIDTEIGNYERAQKLLEEVLDAGRTNLDVGADLSTTLYQLARVFAARGQTEQAIERLRQSLAKGFDDGMIADDEHLRSLHGLPEFEALVGEVERRIAARSTSKNRTG
jgi:serine/threonine-protein kinase